MKTIRKIENEIKNLDSIKIENVEVFTDTYLGNDGIIPKLYKVIIVNERGVNSSNCLSKLMELRQKFNKILADYRSKYNV
jgi:hypothetical protein